MIIVEGQVQVGNTSRLNPARVEFTEGRQLHLTDLDSGEQYRAALDEVRFSSRLGNLPRTLTFPSGPVFTSPDNEQIDRALHHYHDGPGFNLLHLLESRFRYVLLAVIVVALFTWGSVQYGIPAVSRAIAFMLPDSTNQLISGQSLEILDESFFEPSQLPEERRDELLRTFQPIIDAQSSPEQYQVLFRDAGFMGANALALPSGTIIFTDQMVQLAEHDQELVSVLAHEIGHVVHRHGLRRLIQDSFLVAVYALITGDVGGSSNLAVALPGLLLELGYSRDFEREADSYAMQVMQQRGIPLHHFADIMTRLAESHAEDIHSDAETDTSEESEQGSTDWSDFLSTHPSSQERIERFRAADQPSSE